MRWQHLHAIVWLRWRMSLNQARRAGIVSSVLLAIVGVSVALGSLAMFVVALSVGVTVLPRASPEIVMLVWDAVVATFLFFWMAGLVGELQQSEVLSLQKLLHLPISPTGTFVINYLGSLASVGLAAFVPGMLGLSIALVITKGPASLMLFPLLGAFLLMVTAITYQFQGWLASLMLNKRRRRTVIAVTTVAFVVMTQLPNLVGNLVSRGVGQARRAGEVTGEAAMKAAQQARKERVLRVAEQANALVPVGWLPYGAMACARGSVLPAILGTFGAALIGGASLRRSYRTTLRIYTGQFTARASGPAPAAISPRPRSTGEIFLEKQLPGISEHAAAVALMSFRSLTRAPEAKMVLLTPVIVLLMLGSALLSTQTRLPDAARPFMGFAAIGLTLLSLQQLLGNQFGLDRDGFRALVLSASPRRDLLLGRNLAVAPLAAGFGVLLVALVQVVYPMRIDHLLATLAEIGSSYLLFCIVANFTSIVAPQAVASGSLKPAHPKAFAVLLSFGFVFVLPLLIGLAAFPLGVELLLHGLGLLKGVPIYLICSLPELGGVVWLYRRALVWEGRMLQAREQQILAAVAAKVE